MLKITKNQSKLLYLKKRFRIKKLNDLILFIQIKTMKIISTKTNNNANVDIFLILNISLIHSNSIVFIAKTNNDDDSNNLN